VLTCKGLLATRSIAQSSSAERSRATKPNAPNWDPEHAPGQIVSRISFYSPCKNLNG
jgi:hypothetical protein